ncbi:unnamed protein product [Victoria cruziana]
MILVDHAGGIFPAINHSPWNGVTLADFVMPFFLFIVGVSLGLTYKRLSNDALATKKATIRAVKLLILGVILQGGYIHRVFDLSFGVDIAHIRWMGVLQRIAIAYLVAAVCEIWLKDNQDVINGFSLLKKYQLQWLLALAISIIYMVLLYGLYVPDWEFQILTDGASPTMMTYSVKCGVMGDTGPACNAVGMIDRMILGINHLYTRPTYKRTKECSILSPDYGPLPPNAPSWCHAPFDPEGLLSSFMAIVTCIIGLHFGHVLVHFKDHKERILQWMIPSLFFVLLGFTMDLCGMRLNKALYSFTYMCVTAGVAGIAFTGTYVMVDVYNYRRSAKLFELMGLNALALYILVACNMVPIVLQGFYWKSPENNIFKLIGIRR